MGPSLMPCGPRMPANFIPWAGEATRGDGGSCVEPWPERVGDEPWREICGKFSGQELAWILASSSCMTEAGAVNNTHNAHGTSSRPPAAIEKQKGIAH
jgi:hypothetical protein